eukprot:m.50317 g.50317  ORF g.50317 m.50317 type:complete len:224 (-) comp11154_c2_seq1:235-906(-)
MASRRSTRRKGRHASAHAAASVFFSRPTHLIPSKPYMPKRRLKQPLQNEQQKAPSSTKEKVEEAMERIIARYGEPKVVGEVSVVEFDSDGAEDVGPSAQTTSPPKARSKRGAKASAASKPHRSTRQPTQRQCKEGESNDVTTCRTRSVRTRGSSAKPLRTKVATSTAATTRSPQTRWHKDHALELDTEVDTAAIDSSPKHSMLAKVVADTEEDEQEEEKEEKG